MSKKFQPNKKAIKQLVNQGIPEKKDETETIERKAHGYSVRTDYAQKISLLSTVQKKRKWQIVEEALELYFDKYKETIEKHNIS